MKFSQRKGLTKVREAIQIDSIDLALENKLWNIIYYFEENMTAEDFELYWLDFLENKIDEMPVDNYQYPNCRILFNLMRSSYLEDEWYKKYDLIEFLAKIHGSAFEKKCNEVLTKEMSGYRLLNGLLISITSEKEVEEIEAALKNTSKWSSVNEHLNSALKYLSDRENPNFRNSIKESISAVEALCIIITGEQKSTLGKTLNKIEQECKIHPALKSAFKSLYGFTSDAGGIRHALLEDDIKVNSQDAKFMLVTCSAFINYLKIK